MLQYNKEILMTNCIAQFKFKFLTACFFVCVAGDCLLPQVANFETFRCLVF